MSVRQITLDVRPLAQFAAELVDVDVRNVDDAVFAAIYDAWLQYPILRLRDQTLEDADLQAFSRRFGPLECAPMGFVDAAEQAKIANSFVATISNIIEDGRPIGGLGAAEAAWHTDMSYIEHPPTASILYAVETPPSGGDTHYCDMVAALKALPPALAKRARETRLKHDAAHDSVGKLRPGQSHSPHPMAAPGAVHAMVRQHPENDTEALFLGRRRNACVDGLPLAESEALLDEIWSCVALPGATWTQQWQPGDVVIWDNRSVMHRRAAFDSTARRLMRRTQIRSPEAG